MGYVKNIFLLLGALLLAVVLGLYLWDGVMAFLMKGDLFAPYARRLPVTAFLFVLVLICWLIWKRKKDRA